MRIAMLPVVLGFAAAVLGGCQDGGKSKIDHTSPRGLLVSYQQAVSERDYASINAAMESRFRGDFRSRNAAVREYVQALGELAALVESRLGAEQAQGFRRRGAEVLAGMFPSPFEGATADGVVDWQKVMILDAGDFHRVMVADAATDFQKQFVLVHRGGGWFISPHPDRLAAGMEKQYYQDETRQDRDILKQFTRGVEDLKKKVRSGEINSENFQSKMEALGSGVSTAPATLP